MVEAQRDSLLRDMFIRGLRSDMQFAFCVQSPQNYKEAFELARKFEANKVLMPTAMLAPSTPTGGTKHKVQFARTSVQ